MCRVALLAKVSLLVQSDIRMKLSDVS